MLGGLFNFGRGASTALAMTGSNPFTPAALSSVLGPAPAANLVGSRIVSTIYPGPYSGPGQLNGYGADSSETPEMRWMYEQYYRSEPSIRSAIRGKVDEIAGKEVSVQAEDKNKPMDRLAAQFCEWAVEETPGGWDGLIDVMLTPAFIGGVSYSEKTLTIKEWPKQGQLGLSSMWALEQVRSLNPLAIRLQLDQFWNVRAIVNLIRGLEYFSPENVLLYTHNSLYNDPFGQSDLRACVRSAGIIDTAYEAWYTACKIYGLPYMIGLTSSQRVGMMTQAVEALRGGGYAVIDKEDDIRAVNLAASTGTSSFGELIKTCREDIFLAVRGSYTPFLEGQGGANAHNDSEVSEDQAQATEIKSIKAVQRVVRAQLFTWLVGPNFPRGTGIPKLKLGGTNWEKTEKLIQIMKGAQEIGMELDQDNAYETTGLVASAPGQGLKPNPPDAGPGGMPGMGGPPGAGPNPPGAAPPAIPPAPQPAPTSKPPQPEPQAPEPAETFADDDAFSPERIAALADQLLAAARGETPAKTFSDFDESKVSRADDGKFGKGHGASKGDDKIKPPPAGTGGVPHKVKLPKNRKKLTIQQAHAALDAMGYKLAMGKHDLKTGQTFYELTHPDGKTALASTDEIKEIINRGSKGEHQTFADDNTTASLLEIAYPVLLALKAAGDDEAADELAELMGDPERADELAELLSDDDGEGFTATFASAHKDGETWQTGKWWFKREAGKTRRTKNPNATDEPKTPRTGPTPQERAQSLKAGREPARQAARDAYAKAKDAPHTMTHEDVPALMAHLDTLTRDELREHARTAMERMGGYKSDLVRRLVEKISGGPLSAGEKMSPDGTPAKPSSTKAYTLPVESLNVDPKRFQFKLNTSNPAGVTDEMKQVHTWNPDFAGVVSVWKDPADGKTYVVNGHHRHELAGRLGAKEMNVKYIDAPDAQSARGKGALINIAEGRGTAVDAAKFMRDTGTTIEDFAKHGVSLKSGALADQATTLTKLNDKAFARVASGDLEVNKALAVAKHLQDPERQEKLFRLLDKREDEGKQITDRTMEEMAKAMAAVPSVKKVNETLWGDEETNEDVFVQRAELAGAVRSALAQEMGNWAAVSSAKRAASIGDAGNVLNVDENKKRAEAAEQGKNLYDTLVNRKGPISDALNDGAVKLAKAKGRKERDNARAETTEAVRTAIKAEFEKLDTKANAGGEGGNVQGDSGTHEPGESGSVEPERPSPEPSGLTPPSPGFTGTDANGHEWKDGEQVARAEEPGKVDAPEPQAAASEPAGNGKDNRHKKVIDLTDDELKQEYTRLDVRRQALAGSTGGAERQFRKAKYGKPDHGPTWGGGGVKDEHKELYAKVMARRSAVEDEINIRRMQKEGDTEGVKEIMARRAARQKAKEEPGAEPKGEPVADAPATPQAPTDAAPKAKEPHDPDKPKVEYVRAPAGGKVSDVDGKHYRGGQLMPVHGLYSGQEKAPKGDGSLVASPVQANEDAKKRERQPAQPMTPEEIEAKKQQADDQRKWNEMRSGPLGRVKSWLGDSPNFKGLDYNLDYKKWKEFAEQIGPEGIKKIVDQLEPEFHGAVDDHTKRINAERAESRAKDGPRDKHHHWGTNEPLADNDGDWDKNEVKNRAQQDIDANRGKKHEKEVPGSHYARQLIQSMMDEQNHPGRSKLDNQHRLNAILSIAEGKPVDAEAHPDLAAKPIIDTLPTQTPELAAHLKTLIASSDADPSHVDDGHMKRIVDHLNSLPKAQAKAVAEAALGYPVKNTKDGIGRLEGKLIGVRKMLDRQNV